MRSGFREVFRNRSEPAPDDAWERFSAALDDDFKTPAALAVMHEWRDHDLLSPGARASSGSSRSRQEDAPPERSSHSPSDGRLRARRVTSIEADRLRVQIEAAGLGRA